MLMNCRATDIPLTTRRGRYLPLQDGPRIVEGSSKAYNRSNRQSGDKLQRELDWIERIAAGDLRAFEQLMEAYHQRLWIYISRIVGDPGTAEEVLGDVMLGIWRGAERFGGRAKPSTWMFAIARHKALRTLRQQPAIATDPATMAGQPESGPGPETRLVDKDMVRQALRQLSTEHREVLELAFYHGYSYQEIAEIADCPLNTVKTRVFHAKSRLRKALATLNANGALAEDD